MSERKTDTLVEAVFADSEVAEKYVSNFDVTKREKLRGVIDASMMYNSCQSTGDCDNFNAQTFDEKEDDYEFGV